MSSKSKITYNPKLLPCKTYKIITKIEEIEQYFLVRLPGKKKWSVRKNEHFSGLIEPTEFGRGISMNLLSVYQHKDARVRPGGKVKDAHHKPWSEFDRAIPPPFISYKRRANFFGIRIENVSHLFIDSVSVEFKNSSTPDPNFSAIVRVNHCPTKCNYWHFELKIFLRNSNGQEFELFSCKNISNKKKDNLIKEIGVIFQSQITAFLVHSSMCQTRYLPKRLYRKS